MSNQLANLGPNGIRYNQICCCPTICESLDYSAAFAYDIFDRLPYTAAFNDNDSRIETDFSPQFIPMFVDKQPPDCEVSCVTEGHPTNLWTPGGPTRAVYSTRIDMPTANDGLSLPISPSNSTTTHGYLTTILDDCSSSGPGFLEEDLWQEQLPGISNLVQKPNVGFKVCLHHEASGSESASEPPSPPSICSAVSAFSPQPLPNPFACVLEVLRKTPGRPTNQMKTRSDAMRWSKIRQTFGDRESRRKERNNAASRKSRALRKRRFQQMLHETERLTGSNAKLRALLEELNSIMAETKAILVERFATVANSVMATAKSFDT
uniref:BZIP domain-containing protein n=1 Tax=Mesocestoides corti TaxID=53468 RepID=A0A5K3EVK1_MESCO